MLISISAKSLHSATLPCDVIVWVLLPSNNVSTIRKQKHQPTSHPSGLACESAELLSDFGNIFLLIVGSCTLYVTYKVTMLFSALTSKSPFNLHSLKHSKSCMVGLQASCLSCPKHHLRLFKAMTGSLSIIHQYCTCAQNRSDSRTWSESIH
jgi:hypothetical protein